MAPYGTWASPIGAEALAAGARPLSAPRIAFDADGAAQVYWLEGQTLEQGRVAVATPAGVITPAPFNVRSRVNEYGGGAYAAAGGTVWFSNFADNAVYASAPGQAPRAMTSDRSRRYADLEPDPSRGRLIAVCEDHRDGPGEPVDTLVAIDASPGPTDRLTVLASGYDFYSAPRVSPDGAQLAWLCWNHPQMPWNGTELWLADLDANGLPHHARHVAGGMGQQAASQTGQGRLAGPTAEALVQPVWSPEGRLYVVSDRSGWWNLYQVEPDDEETPGGALRPVQPLDAEFGRPMWVFGQSMFGFIAPRLLVATCIDRGVSRLLWLDLDGTDDWTPIDTPYTDITELRAGPGFIVVQAGAADRPDSIVRIDLPRADDGTITPAVQVLATSTDDVTRWASVLSQPESIRYTSEHGRDAYAFFYAPRNDAYRAPANERPPLIVTSHGGPTSMSTSSLRLAIQYWTSRGFAVLDVNYGGSSGYGREYRDRLAGAWGIVDVQDCVAGARYVAAQGRVDSERMAIRGSSASGFTTLCALTFHRVFKAGASYYGVSDLAALDADTHKFESRYTGYLVASGAQRQAVYAQRSPILHTDRLSCPMIFFQGNDDKVVPPSQSESMVAALRARGIPVAYLSFDGEGHGFRQAATIRRTLEAELLFYARVFGFAPADRIEPIEIDGL